MAVTPPSATDPAIVLLQTIYVDAWMIPCLAPALEFSPACRMLMARLPPNGRKEED